MPRRKRSSDRTSATGWLRRWSRSGTTEGRSDRRSEADVAFNDLKALFLNCSIKYDGSESHTRRLLARSAGIMDSQGVDVEILHVLEHDIAFGMVKDATEDDGGNRPRDDW